MRQPPGPEQHDPGSLQSEQEHLRALQHARQRRVAKAVVILLLLTYLVAFVAENTDRANLHFVLFSHRARLVWVVLASAILGMIVGYLIGRPGKQLGRHRKDAPKQK